MDGFIVLGSYVQGTCTNVAWILGQKLAALSKLRDPFLTSNRTKQNLCSHSCVHWAETYMLGRTLEGCIFLLLQFTDTARFSALFERNSSDCSSLCEFLDMIITDLQ